MFRALLLVAVTAAALWYHVQCGDCCRAHLWGGEQLQGRDSVVLITGASSGIGAELAQQYAARGVRLVLVARRGDELTKVAAASRARGAAAVLALQADMSNHTEISTVLDATVKAFGRLDALVLNHAAFQDSLLLEYADTAALAAELRRLCEVNIVGIMVAAMKALPLLHATGGRLVFVSSGSTIVAPPFHTAYGASKAAMNALFSGLRAELALSHHNVSISVLILGLIGTDANNRGGLASRALPVKDCASGMLCAIDARAHTAYVPQMLAPYSTLIHFLPALAPSLIQAEYIDHVPEYATRIAAVALPAPEGDAKAKAEL